MAELTVGIELDVAVAKVLGYEVDKGLVLIDGLWLVALGEAQP